MSRDVDPAVLAVISQQYNRDALDARTDEAFVKIHALCSMYPSGIAIAALMNALTYRITASWDDEAVDQSVMSYLILLHQMAGVIKAKRRERGEST